MQCHYTEIVQRLFKYNDIQYTNLTPDKTLNSLVYRTLFCVNIYGSYKLSKNSPVFLAHPVYVCHTEVWMCIFCSVFHEVAKIAPLNKEEMKLLKCRKASGRNLVRYNAAWWFYPMRSYFCNIFLWTVAWYWALC